VKLATQTRRLAEITGIIGEHDVAKLTLCISASSCLNQEPDTVETLVELDVLVMGNHLVSADLGKVLDGIKRRVVTKQI
jgi:hypothetical protein